MSDAVAGLSAALDGLLILRQAAVYCPRNAILSLIFMRHQRCTRSKRLLFSLLLLPAAVFGAPAGLPLAKPEEVGMSSELLARIRPAMQRYIDAELVPGTVTMIARKGKVVHFEAQGYMDLEQGTLMREDAIFRIASMSKPITSVALMMLWEEGKFQLNDPVSKYLPEFGDQRVSTTGDASGATGDLVPVKRPATIRDMLTHTAGMANSYIGNTDFYRRESQVR